MDGLLVVIILEDLIHKLLNLHLFLLDHAVDDVLHPGEVGVHVHALLALHVLSPVQEVVLLLELRPQLLAPLRQDAQDGWAFDHHVHARDLRLGVLAHVLGDLAADRPGCVGLHPRSVLLVVHLLHQVLLALLLRLDRPVLHPLPRLQVLEGPLHVIIKILVECPNFALGVYFVLLLIDPAHEVVHQLHYEVVVVPAFPVLEAVAVIGIEEDIVLQCLDVVDLLDLSLKRLVDHLRLGHRVLGQQVRRDSVIHMLIDVLDLLRGEVVMLVEADDVADDVLRAVYLRLVVAHVAALEVVKSRREDLVAEPSDPYLQLTLA